MHTFGSYLTPEEAVEAIRPRKPVEYYQKLAKKHPRCSVCGQPAWRLVNTGLCFTCTTGESDASDDCELR